MPTLEEMQLQGNIAIQIAQVQSGAQKDIANINLQTEIARSRADAIRVAKETLIENKRTLPVEERGVTDQEIVDFAANLVAFVNQT